MMAGQSSFRTVAVTLLLLPGLVAALPPQGPCGLCERGLPCATMELAGAERLAHGCCSGATDETPGQAPQQIVECDCGRPAPPATATAQGAVPEPGDPGLSRGAADAVTDRHAALVVVSSAPPAPLPSPPLFLAACAFLT